MAGPSVKIKVGADLSPAQAAVDKFQDATAVAAQKSGQTIATSIEQGANKAAKSLGQVEAKAEAAERSLKGMFDLQKIQAAAGAFGALKSIIDNTAVSVFGMSDATATAASKSLDMATQGIALGALFGPLGAAIGGATGALIGWIAGSKDAAKAEEDLTRKVAEETAKREELRQKENKRRLLDLADNTEAYSEMYDKIVAATDAIKASNLTSKEQGDLLRARKEDTISFTEAMDNYRTAVERGSTDELADAQRILGKAMRNAAEDVAMINQALGEHEKAQGGAAVAVKNTEENILDWVDSIVTARKALKDFNAEVLKNLEEDLESFVEISQADQDLLESMFNPSGERPKITVEVEVDPSAYNAAQDKIENFATTSKRVFKDASKDFKAAGAVFLQEAIASAATKVAENVSKGEKAYKGLGVAVGEAAQAQILALGKTWSFKAGGEAAEALASLAFGNLPGAALHGQAAVMFGALALAAGAGAGIVGRALPDSTSAPSAPAPGASTPSASGGGASFGGGSTFQELAPAQYNFAPGGTVIFAGDNRGRAQYGRYTDGAISTGRAATPTLKRT